MAKKKNTKDKRDQINNLVEERELPKNILPFGQRVEENKNIYISQKIYKEIHKFTQNKTTNESGGMLIGYVIDEFEKTNIVINGFIEAKYCEATPTTLTFTHETWDYVHSEMEKKYPESKIVGWIHTHPDFGIFLSEYDKFIHENFFTEDYQIAYVVDPIQKIEGFYFWINGKLEKCKGFYVYDKTGVEIDVLNEKDKSVEDKECEETLFSAKNIALVIMGLFIVFLLLSNMSQSAEIKKLQQEQKDLIASANSSLGIMQQQINTLSAEVSELKKPASKTEEGLKTDNTQNDNEILNKTEDATEDVNSDLEKAIAESATEGTTEGVIVPDNEIESYTEGVSNSE